MNKKKTYAEECLERSQSASKGPWYVNSPDMYWDIRSYKETIVSCGAAGEVTVGIEDAEFIAHARTDVPELAKRLERVCQLLRGASKHPRYSKDPWLLELVDELETPLEKDE